MKKVKKLLAMIMAMTMVLGMAMTVSAAAPSSSDTATITVTNVEENATVTAYKIVDAEYNANGLIGYKVVDGYSISDKVNFVPTANEIVAIANTIMAGQETGIPMPPTVEAPTTYTATVTAGEYLVLISGEKIYNPMVVSAYYTNANDDGSLQPGSVNADSDWVLNGDTVFAKSEEVPIEKIVDKKDAMVGDTVQYTINGTIPSYSGIYTNPVYSIEDKLTNATYETSGDPATVVEPEVTIGGEQAEKDVDYTLVWNPDTGVPTGFTINFLNLTDYAGEDEQARKVVITYKAVISETAVSTAPATNEVTLNYGHSDDVKQDVDKTYTYTFEIDDEFEKVDENGNPLGGATFTLYDTEGEVVGTCLTEDIEGKAYIHFEGLAAGTYTLKETNAPDGYTINNTIYTVSITAEYEEDGQLKEGFPKIDIVGTDGSNNVDGASIVVQNTKLSSLPSTGGIGTTIFTIGGCAIMIAAAALYFASKRKSEEN